MIDFAANDLIGPAQFHDAFARVFGFPNFYGRNMNAWIDCMSYLRNPHEGMSTVHLGESETLTIRVHDFEALRDRAPEQWADLIECSAFVNRRAVDRGDTPYIALAF
ncbi:MAG: hypothetical protein EBU97_03310 [Rhodobacteraceae bacterium]|nr:hypothetical protein [Paracoccaceae bacterium]